MLRGLGPQDKLLLELAGQPSPFESCGTLQNSLGRRKTAGQGEEKEFGLVTDEGPSKTEQITAATDVTFQLLNHSNKPTGHEFWGARLLRASECLGFMMQETVTDVF